MIIWINKSLINGNEIEIEFNYKVLELILNLTKKITSGCRQFGDFENYEGPLFPNREPKERFSSYYSFHKPVFKYYCDIKEQKNPIIVPPYF